MRLQQNKQNKQHYVNLPKELVEAMDWNAGIDLEIKFNGINKLLLVKK